MISSIKVHDVEELIGKPAYEWEGRCHEIANDLIETGIVVGKLRYGIWIGPIAGGSNFSGRAFTHHGWVECEDGVIVDPTRWVFEGVPPYIYEGPSDHYDVCGDEIRQMGRGEYPEFDPKDKIVPDVPRALIMGLDMCGVDVDEKITARQAHWLSGMSLKQLGPVAKLLYSWMADSDLKAFIPIDNWNYVMEDDA